MYRADGSIKCNSTVRRKESYCSNFLKAYEEIKANKLLLYWPKIKKTVIADSLSTFALVRLKFSAIVQ